ncbi:MAG: hypothetical protein U0790_20180 [Isosphaeraceae bacterium]
MICVSSCLVLTLGLLSQAANESDSWSQVDSEDGRYSVVFPADPSSKVQDLDTAAGKVHQEIHFCRLDGALFTVQRLRLESAVPAPQSRGWLTAQRKGYVARDAKVLDEKALDREGAIGEEFDYQGKPPRGEGTVRSRTRHFLSGQDYFSLTVMSAINQPLPAETARFLDSLKLNRSEGQASGTPKPASGAAGRAPVRIANATPEEALRTFMLAMMTHDEASLREVTLPAEGFEWLLAGQAAPAEAVAGMKAQLAKQPVRRLKPGDRFSLPRGRSAVVGKDEVGPDRAVLIPEGAPLPTRLEKVQGRWKVDARPFIAGRKAADAARRKAEARKSGGAG